jgi:hypothetical protein
VNAATNPQVSAQDLEQERRRIALRLEEVAKLSETNVPPGAFYGELLKRLLESLAAPAGVIWARTAQGNLQLQFQINLKEVGLDKSDDARQSHEELLRQAMSQPRPFHLPPHSGVGPKEEGKVSAGNPTEYLLLIAPILLNEQVAGLIEVWQGSNRPAQAITGYLQYMTFMADLAARYQRNQMMGQLAGQQQVWTQLEAFARQVHASLNPTEVAYLVANEGRRLIECDRVTVAVRYGSRSRIEAVSGADVVERRSNLVRLMRTLCERVLDWGEKLVFSGTRDDSLPPKVLAALDAYLAESNSKLLIVQPLRDERESDKRPPRSALLMECFEPPSEPQQLISRLDVVARHSAPALYNAVEHRRIPMRLLWMPLAKAQEGIGGKGKAISAVVVALLSFLGAMLYFMPYTLKMDSNGKVVPAIRRIVYTPTGGKVEYFEVKQGDVVREDRRLAILSDLNLEQKWREIEQKIKSADDEAEQARQNSTRGGVPEKERIEFRQKMGIQQALARLKRKEREEFVERYHMRLNNATSHAEFELRAPLFTPEEKLQINRPEWTILNGNFEEEWTGRFARPSDGLLHVGVKDGPWEIELRIPQKHIGQVLLAFERNNGKPLDIDFLLQSDPTRTYRGKLHRDKVAGMALPNRDEKDESEPEVLAYASIDDESIDPAYRLLPGALTSGTEVHAKVRCGKHRMGYALFYGVWEFFYEKVVFFF